MIAAALHLSLAFRKGAAVRAVLRSWRIFFKIQFHRDQTSVEH